MLRVLTLASLVFVAACGGQNDGAQSAEAVPVAPANDPRPTDALEQAVFDAALPIRRGMGADDPYQHGTLEERQPFEQTVFLDRARCYRFVAAGAPSIGELDLTIADSNAVIVQSDSREGNVAMVGGDEAVCPQEPATYRLSLRATRGAGAYAMRVYASAR